MERVVKRHVLNQAPLDTGYWLSRPVSERLDAVELLRLAWLGSHPSAIGGIQRVCRIRKLHDPDAVAEIS